MRCFLFEHIIKFGLLKQIKTKKQNKNKKEETKLQPKIFVQNLSRETNYLVYLSMGLLYSEAPSPDVYNQLYRTVFHIFNMQQHLSKSVSSRETNVDDF